MVRKENQKTEKKSSEKHEFDETTVCKKCGMSQVFAEYLKTPCDNSRARETQSERAKDNSAPEWRGISNSYATLFILRAHDRAARKWKVEIEVNRKTVGSLRDYSTLIVKIAPGKHSIRATLPAARKFVLSERSSPLLQVELGLAEKLYLECGYREWGIGCEVWLEKLPESLGKRKF